MSFQPRSFDALPFDVWSLILSHVPILDYQALKLAGNRRLTELIRDALSRLSRTQYLDAIAKEDARQNGLPKGFCRKPMEILIERGRPELVNYYKAKYQRGRHDNKEYDASRRMAAEKRSYSLALQWAAFYGQQSIIQLLVHRVNLRSGKLRRTALHYAAMADQVGAAALLLQHGAYVNASDDDGKTPLEYAIKHEATGVEGLLKAHGGHTDWPTILKTEDWARYIRDWKDGATELFTYQSHVTRTIIRRCWQLKACMRYYSLRRTDAPPQDISRHQKHILRLAIRRDDPHMVQFVLDESSEFDVALSTALCLAAQWGRVEITRLLLDGGADPNKAAGYPAQKPMQTALLHGQNDLVELYCGLGFSIDTTNYHGQTALHLAVEKYSGSTIQNIINLGADMNMADVNGRTPLHVIAANKVYTYAAEILLAEGADVDPRDSQGNTPLHYTLPPHCETETLDMCTCLLDHCADPNIPNSDGNFPLHVILNPNGRIRSSLEIPNHDRQYSFFLIFVLFFTDRADPNVVDPQGRTPLHLLLSAPLLNSTYCLMCDLLLQKGANVNARDHLGLTPKWCLTQFRHEDIEDRKAFNATMQLLMDHGAVL
ncbi:uncharacterized protein DSM5745_07900 [Aspergillus mulundensis]|uniref:Uncharacterized protein n=1 Tax=Aspergillus mulundensis TaxID=1810919 RepID=A0A3D8RFL1_9EURO|nr:hypothetical protein DSM5745_07900 [Aspergillus mulundensis]RDW72728.1 hypothetical protein DSM5745_07900 [Aspergillus mulundensis]